MLNYRFRLTRINHIPRLVSSIASCLLIYDDARVMDFKYGS
jgi:hypothetical protein